MCILHELLREGSVGGEEIIQKLFLSPALPQRMGSNCSTSWPPSQLSPVSKGLKHLSYITRGIVLELSDVVFGV